MLYCWRYDMYAVNSHKISAWFCWPYPSSCPLLSYKTCCIVHTASHLHNLPFSPVPSYCTTHFCLLSYKFQLDHHFLILNLHSCCLIPHSIMFNIQSLIIPWNIITYIYIYPSISTVHQQNIRNHGASTSIPCKSTCLMVKPLFSQMKSHDILLWSCHVWSLKSPREAPQSELGVGENFGVGGAFAKWGAVGSPGVPRDADCATSPGSPWKMLIP